MHCSLVDYFLSLISSFWFISPGTLVMPISVKNGNSLLLKVLSKADIIISSLAIAGTLHHLPGLTNIYELRGAFHLYRNNFQNKKIIRWKKYSWVTKTPRFLYLLSQLLFRDLAFFFFFPFTHIYTRWVLLIYNHTLISRRTLLTDNKILVMLTKGWTPLITNTFLLLQMFFL